MISEISVIIFALASGVAGILYGLYLTFWVIRQEAGNETMQTIALAIQEGAAAYLNRQYRAVGFVAGVMFLILWLAGFWSEHFGLLTAVGFLVGIVILKGEVVRMGSHACLCPLQTGQHFSKVLHFVCEFRESRGMGMASRRVAWAWG